MQITTQQAAQEELRRPYARPTLERRDTLGAVTAGPPVRSGKVFG